jgi:hypothetical protein
MAAAAAARRAAAPARAPRPKAPTRKKPVAVKAAAAAPARKAPARRRAPSRRPGAQLIPIAAGAASAVRQLPDSSLIVRMTRGRVWIAVLGILLVGIVGINVVTLSLSAAAGHIDRNIQALEQENPLLRSLDAKRSGAARVRHEAAGFGLTAAASNEVTYLQASPKDVATAAQRLAAAAESGY